jgi:hypothetical protein
MFTVQLEIMLIVNKYQSSIFYNYGNLLFKLKFTCSSLCMRKEFRKFSLIMANVYA